MRFKLENLQTTGSFKLRGATRRLAALTPDERARGVITASAGNHGMGVACAARALGIRATVLVSELTPEVKRAGIARLGATVEVSGANYDAAEAVARARATGDDGPVFVSAYDDEHVIAGNGDSLAEELLVQAPDISRVVCPIGGGGLISGLGRTLAPRGISVVGAQPTANCAMYESFQQGKALTDYAGGETLAEGCEGAVAQRTYDIAREHVSHIALVSESAIRRAIAFCYDTVGTVVEASGAVGVAAMRGGKVTPATDGVTVVVITGGNIEPSLLDEVLAEGDNP